MRYREELRGIKITIIINKSLGDYVEMIVIKNSKDCNSSEVYDILYDDIKGKIESVLYTEGEDINKGHIKGLDVVMVDDTREVIKVKPEASNKATGTLTAHSFSDEEIELLKNAFSKEEVKENIVIQDVFNNDNEDEKLDDDGWFDDDDEEQFRNDDEQYCDDGLPK